MTTINTPTGGDDELKSRLEGLTDEQKDKLLEMLKQDKEEREHKQEKVLPDPKLIGHENAILLELRENHVKIEENTEMMGYKGKKLHIELPAIGNFEGFKFNCFISKETLYKDDFESDWKLVTESYGKNDICKLLQEINKYMKELGVETDGDIDYEKDLEFPADSLGTTCNAGKCLMKITSLDGWNSVLDYWCWLKDEEKGEDHRGGKENLRNMWGCVEPDVCYFKWGRNNLDCKLLLKLSD